MKLITILYILNATLLLLHEIESAYEKEWDILKLPGEITGFLILHIPLIIAILYGLVEIEKGSTPGLVFGIITGIGGIIPLIVHKIIVKKDEHFNRLISNGIIYTNVLTGAGLTFLSFRFFV